MFEARSMIGEINKLYYENAKEIFKILYLLENSVDIWHEYLLINKKTLQ